MPCSVNEQLISVVLWLLQAEPRRADGPGSPDGTGTLLLFLQVQGGHLVGFESAGISVAAIEDVSSECWPMALFEDDGVHRNPKDNQSYSTAQIHRYFLKRKKHLTVPYPCS